MEINWVILGWLIDMTLNGFVWLIIAAFSLPLIELTDKWTRKAIKWMDKPDKWILEYKPNMNLFNNNDFDKFITTFSNSPCWPNYCLRQSYPDTYPNENNPTTGFYERDLNPTCSMVSNSRARACRL